MSSAGGKSRRLMLGVAVSGLLCASAEAASPPDTVARDLFGDRVLETRVLAPFPLIRFCREQPEDCRPTGGSPATTIPASALQTVERINRSVNRAIRPRSDRNDRWDADVSAGDCEDYVLTKRRRLMAAGLPPAALRIAVARTATGEGHAILLARTEDGDLILDNRTDAIRLWNRTDLKWIKVSSAENPKIWYAVP
jgi:predicted transglutaminase-like cysteine proteinase